MQFKLAGVLTKVLDQNDFRSLKCLDCDSTLPTNDRAFASLNTLTIDFDLTGGRHKIPASVIAAERVARLTAALRSSPAALVMICVPFARMVAWVSFWGY
jgi:hypothetical protein